MRRLLTVLALFATAASAQTLQKRPAVSTPQTARQALIELLTTKSDKVFEAHLPEALLVRLDQFKSKDAKTGKTSSPVKSSNTALVDSKEVQFFPTGSTLLVYTAAKTGQKIEVTIDREDLTADGNDFEFGFHVYT
jgi:hypothetical protein